MFVTPHSDTHCRSHGLVCQRIRMNSNCLRHQCGHYHANEGVDHMTNGNLLDSSGRPDVQIVTRSECSFQKFALMTTSVFTIAEGWKQLNIVISCFSLNMACHGNSVTLATFDLSEHITATGCGE